MPATAPAHVGAEPWSGFAEAAEAALRLLQDTAGLDLWAVTQLRGDEQVVITARSTGFPIPPGAVLPWAESLCVHMCNGGPRVAPDVTGVPGYAGAGIRRAVQVGAYVGAPLTLEGGQVFGTVCGLGHEEQPESLHAVLPLLEFVAGLLSTLLSKEMLAAELSATAAHAYGRANEDPATGLLNARGWQQALHVQEDRLARYGEQASVVVLRLGAPGATDDAMRRLAGVLAAACRPSDVLARLGDVEFAVLAPACGTAGAQALRKRLLTALTPTGLDVLLGTAAADGSGGVSAAWRAAAKEASGTVTATVPAPQPAPSSESGPEAELQVGRQEHEDVVIVQLRGSARTRSDVLTLRALLPALRPGEDRRPVLLDLTALDEWSLPAQVTLLRAVRGLRQYGRFAAAYGLKDDLARQAAGIGWERWVSCYHNLATARAHLPATGDQHRRAPLT